MITIALNITYRDGFSSEEILNRGIALCAPSANPQLMSEGTAKGRPRSVLDTIIAAVAMANDCIVVTGNEKDFPGVALINPLRRDI